MRPANTTNTSASSSAFADGDAAGAVELMDLHLRELERHLTLDNGLAPRSLAHLLGLA